MKRYLILLLILTLILCSCAELTGDNSAPTDGQPDTTDATVPSVEETVEYTALSALEDRNMEGATVVITAVSASDFTADGIYMYDAALAGRNAAIGEKYNATLAVTERDADNLYYELAAHMAEGIYYSDVLAIPMSEVGRFARDGLIKNLAGMDGINKDAEYYVKTDAFTDRDATYAYMCDSITAGYGYCVFFNSHLAEEKGIDFYSMVSEGTWSWSKFAEYTSAMPATGYTYGDEEQFVNAIVSSCGLQYTTLYEADGRRDADYTGEFADAVMALADTVFNNEGYAGSDDPAALFERGGCLFYVAPLYEAEKFATMADSYGVLPLPTYEGGTDYKTYMSPDTPVLCIPEGVCASENAPYLLEALAAASEAELTEKYLLYMANFALHSEEAVLCARLIEESATYDYVYAFGPRNNPVANCTYWATQQAIIYGKSHANLYGVYVFEFRNFVN